MIIPSSTCIHNKLEYHEIDMLLSIIKASTNPIIPENKKLKSRIKFQIFLCSNNFIILIFTR